jgi:hypothetical protein
MQVHTANQRPSISLDQKNQTQLTSKPPNERPLQTPVNETPQSTASAITPPSEPAASAPPQLSIDDVVIRSAVRSSKGAVRSLAEASGQMLDTPQETKDRQLTDAVVHAGNPDCLRPDALKHDPPHVGPIELKGILTIPFLTHAVISGKCKQ